MHHTTNQPVETIDTIQARMAEIRAASQAARSQGDTLAENALDGELTYLGQRLRNLRTAPDYRDDRCCPTCP